MNGKKVKSLRRLAYRFSNRNSKGLLHQGTVEIFQENAIAGKKDSTLPWFQRVFLRRYANDSFKKVYKVFKRLYRTNQFPEILKNQLV